MNLPLRNSRIRLSQGQIFWREIGQGQTLVYLHGSWWTGDQWMGVLPTLSPHHHCLIPDLLGFGESGQPQGRCSIALQVESLREFLDFLRVRRCILVGHSVGAWIAATYALTYPDRVSGLVLLAPEGVHTSQLSTRWGVSRLLARRIPLMDWILKSLHALAKPLGKGQALQTAIRQRRHLRSAPVACQILFQRRRAELEAEDLGDRLSNLTCPLMLLQGDRDDRIAMALTHAYAQAASSSIKMIPGQTARMEPWLHHPNGHSNSQSSRANGSSISGSTPINASAADSYAPDRNSDSSDEYQTLRAAATPSTLTGEAIDNTSLKAMLQTSQVSHRPAYPGSIDALNGAIAYAIKDFIELHHL